MTSKEYQEKASFFISSELDENTLFINAALGMAGETGEVVDIIKKYTFHGHELDVEKLKNEVGDVCWYIAELATTLGISIDDFFDANINKLSKRYPDGFNKERSINRKELGIE